MRPVRGQRKSAIGSSHNIPIVYYITIQAEERWQTSINPTTSLRCSK
jgi:hypothetical protein